MLGNMAKNVVRHGRVRTTLAKAKEAKRVIDRLITLGKEGSVHSRRRAYRILQDRDLVKRLFAEVAPRFTGAQGGYTRVLHLSTRPGDGAPQALLELTQRAIEGPTVRPQAKTTPAKSPTPSAASAAPSEGTKKKPKGFLEGIRGLFKKSGQEDA